jgi:hypothetical protein
MNEYLLNLGLWTLTVYVGARIILWLLFSSSQRELENAMREAADEKIRVVRLEKYNELLLAYDEENNLFLGQGLTETEVKQRLVTRFPDKIFLLNKQPFGDIDSIGIKL